MLHGWAMSGRVWRFQEPLASRWRLLAPDLPGHGYSPVPPNLDHFTVPLLARNLREMLEELHLERVAILGWSLGSLVAMRLAELLGDRLTSLILVGGTPRFCADTDYASGVPAQDVRGLGLRLRNHPQNAICQRNRLDARRTPTQKRALTKHGPRAQCGDRQGSDRQPVIEPADGHARLEPVHDQRRGGKDQPAPGSGRSQAQQQRQPGQQQDLPQQHRPRTPGRSRSARGRR